MSKEKIRIDPAKLERIMTNILRLEQRNNKTKMKNDKDMVFEIKQIIIDELKEKK